MGKLWRINETPNMADAPGQQTILAVEFESAGQSFNSWSASYINMGFFTFESITYHGNGTTTDVYTNDGWASAEYRDIAIFGGADAATLEAWLENNAELLDDDVEPTITNYRIVTVDELTQTAFAIRQATGTNAPIEWESGYGFRDALENTRPPVERTFTENGTYERAGGFSPVIVNVRGDVEPYEIGTNEIVTVSVTKTAKPILPTGYTLVEYIRANGTQYIDTGVIANSPRTAQFDVEFMSRGVTQTPCGAQANNANAMIFASIYYYGLTFSYGSASSPGLGNLTNNKKYNIVTSLRNGYQTLALDGANQGQMTRTGDLVNDIPFYLFANNNNGTPTGLCDARIYRCAIHNGNSINTPKLCDLVPCREEATGKYGMFDLVSNTFKGNSGTGDFEGGPEVQNYKATVNGFTASEQTLVEGNLDLIFEA